MKNLVNSKNPIVSNFSYLSLFHLFNLLLPFITYPYLIRVLGAELYGLVVFAQSVIAYFQILINFGFDISATKRVSLNVKNKKKLSEILFSVFFFKLLLFVLSFLILIGLLYFIENFKTNKLLFIFSFLICINELLFPQWYFQGIEKMKYITIINILSKLTFVAVIFAFIREPQDYIYVPLIYGIGALVGGLFSLYIIFIKNRQPFVMPRFNRLVNIFKESVPFFFSRSASIFTVKTNTIFIGAFLGYSEVAYYDLAFKLVNVMQTPFMILSQAIYPNLVKTQNMGIIRDLIKYVLGFGMLIVVFILIFSKIIILIIGGAEMQEASFVLRLMSSYIPIVGISYLFGASVLVVKGYSKEYNLSVVLSFFFYVCLLLVLYMTSQINLITMTLAFILPELFIALFRSTYIYIRKIL